MKKNGIALLAGGLAFVWALSGCNVLEPLTSKQSKDLGYQGLLLRGNAALDAGNAAQNTARQDTAAGNRAKALGDTATANARFAAGAAAFKSATPYFQEAIAFYDSAMKRYPEGSEAYLFHAQAIVHLYGIDYDRINSEFKKADTKKGLPFIHGADTLVQGGDTLVHPASTVQGVDSLYYPINSAVSDLEHILRPAHDTLYLTLDHKLYMPPDSNLASDGRVSSSVARLDLGILSAVKSLLIIMDLDGSGHIDSLCKVGIGGCDTVTSEKARLTSLIKLTTDLTLDTLNTQSLSSKAKELSDNPGDINGYVQSMQQPLASAAYNLDSVHSSYQSHGQTALSDNIAKTVSRIQDMSNFIGYIQYNDSIDNDNDMEPVDTASKPMLWHDFDDDHGTRYDYDDNSGDAYLSYVTGNGTNYGNPGDIGHPIHRYLKRGALYFTYDDLMKMHPQMVKDTSINGRIPLMKKRCKTLVDSFVVNGGMPASLVPALKGACDTFSTVLKNGTSKPAHSDWIAGTPGVDEELLDGFDNDYDGITDEDSRNQQGYDDDNDARLNVGMLYTTIPDSMASPMRWLDNNHNGCIDMDPVAHPTVAGDPLTREFCIGTLENRLYLARWGVNQYGPDDIHNQDSVAHYYAPFTGEGSANSDCIYNFNNRLDPKFKAAFNPTADEANVACTYEHVWRADKPGTGVLQNSEWTGGTFGIDEEVCGDGIDNDGDGWVDEDCAAKGAHGETP